MNNLWLEIPNIVKSPALASARKQTYWVRNQLRYRQKHRAHRNAFLNALVTMIETH